MNTAMTAGLRWLKYVSGAEQIRIARPLSPSTSTTWTGGQRGRICRQGIVARYECWTRMAHC
eukprot:scaffold604_cov384-Prasinococcus_capsulatus_cf.AAC.33